MRFFLFINETQNPSAGVGAHGANGHRVQQHVPVVQEIGIVFVMHHRLDTAHCFVR